MLKIWVLQAGRGDSIVIEYHGHEGAVFGVVDSNHTGTGDPPALRKLRELGAQRLSFVALTHPHNDHYTGLSNIMAAYEGAIDSFYSFPILNYITNPVRLRKLSRTYTSFVESTESPTAKKRAHEFIEILVRAKEQIGLPNWEEPVGVKNQIMPAGFDGVLLEVLLPPASAKGRYFQMIENGDTGIVDGNPNLNHLSLAFRLSYAGKSVVLGGDGTFENWIDQNRKWKRGSVRVDATAVKLPHHGSGIDSQESVLRNLYSAEQPRFGVISANGTSHPHSDTLKALEQLGVEPYCTNLAKQCGNSLRSLVPYAGLDPTFRRLLNSLGEDPSEHVQQPCQGDILIRIDPNGVVDVEPEYKHPCPYRDVADLFGPPA
ncbi:MAG: hypothetical protein LPK58_05595 [Gammaproteobacteria bacterium]|nr:hypothetical protein [Gammaproteobacteria bacterium]MDX5375115.1 hypothetical protein [Gammaproteobacteria bacterium]